MELFERAVHTNVVENLQLGLDVSGRVERVHERTRVHSLSRSPHGPSPFDHSLAQLTPGAAMKGVLV